MTHQLNFMSKLGMRVHVYLAILLHVVELCDDVMLLWESTTSLCHYVGVQ